MKAHTTGGRERPALVGRLGFLLVFVVVTWAAVVAVVALLVRILT
jgi:hypothetical protein